MCFRAQEWTNISQKRSKRTYKVVKQFINVCISYRMEFFAINVSSI